MPPAAAAAVSGSGLGPDMSALNRRVVLEQQENMAPSTDRSYTAVKVEFKEFCQSVYSEVDEDERELVTQDKVYAFLFYVAYRNQRSTEEHWRFDRADYD